MALRNKTLLYIDGFAGPGKYSKGEGGSPLIAINSFANRKNPLSANANFLFFGSNHIKGLQKTKEAMWAVDKEGRFTFSDNTNPNQLVLFEKQPNFKHLENLIKNRFKSQTGRELNGRTYDEMPSIVAINSKQLTLAHAF